MLIGVVGVAALIRHRERRTGRIEHRGAGFDIGEHVIAFGADRERVGPRWRTGEARRERVLVIAVERDTGLDEGSNRDAGGRELGAELDGRGHAEVRVVGTADDEVGRTATGFGDAIAIQVGEVQVNQRLGVPATI